MEHSTLQVSPADCLAEGFAATVLSGIDRDAAISPEAAGLLEKVAADFLAALQQEAIKMARMRRSTALAKTDVYFALQTLCAMALPGARAIEFPAAPAQEYSKQLSAVQAFRLGE
jgi:hypothetical protein